MRTHAWKSVFDSVLVSLWFDFELQSLTILNKIELHNKAVKKFLTMPNIEIFLQSNVDGRFVYYPGDTLQG